jgi:hypothetical protein
MWNQPTEAQLAIIPKLYETEHIPTEDKIVHCHFVIGGCHWFIVEYDQVDTMFGFCILNNDFEMAEWGYIGLGELKSMNIRGYIEVEFDCYWNPRSASEVELIQKGGGIVSDPRDEENGGAWTWHTLQN